MTRRLRLAQLALAALLVTACQQPALLTDRRQILSDTTEKVILPIYRELSTRLGALRGAAAALSTGPSQENLRAARDAYRAARRPWKLSEAFLIGPAETLRSLPALDWPSVDAPGIEVLIASAQPIDADAIAQLGSTQKGFLSVEHVLFDPARPDAEVLAALSGSDRRRSYVSALTEAMDKSGAALRDAWEPTGGDFAAEVREAGTGSAAFETQKQAVDALLNRMIFLVEKVAVTRIGKPLGREAGGVPQPDAEESRRSDNTIRDLADNLRGALAIYTCTHVEKTGLPLADLVRRQSEEADASLRAAFAAAIASIEGIPPPFRTAISMSPGKVQDAYERVKEVQRLLSTQITGLLGVTVKFNDNDGD